MSHLANQLSLLKDCRQVGTSQWNRLPSKVADGSIEWAVDLWLDKASGKVWNFKGGE